MKYKDDYCTANEMSCSKELGKIMESKVLGKGNTAEVIEYGKESVCKLFLEGYPKEYAALELHNAKIMKQEGIPVPEVYGIVENNSRVGIIYERIYGQSLMEVLFQERNAAFVFDLLIILQQELFKHHSKELISYKDFLIESMREKGVRNDFLKKKILLLPEGDFICHGDFHPGNIILKPDQTAVVIDFMNVCCGRWEYDVARTYVILAEFSESMSERLKGIFIADVYLEKMNVQYGDIKEYVEIISEYRRFE